jgi:hypothetical protein
MRRHAESLAILSGAAPGRSWTEPVPVIDVIRAAMAEVEDYKRVVVLTTAEDAVVAPAVADMIHLLAELIENATMFSPSGTRVEVRAERVANGFAIEIDDRGLGIEPAQLDELNEHLASPPDFDLANADRLGLFVGAKLAARHGVRVSLRPSAYGGTSAIVLLPNAIVAAPAKPETAPPAEPARQRAGPLGSISRHPGGWPWPAGAWGRLRRQLPATQQPCPMRRTGQRRTMEPAAACPGEPARRACHRICGAARRTAARPGLTRRQPPAPAPRSKRATSRRPCRPAGGVVVSTTGRAGTRSWAGARTTPDQIARRHDG